ncbi:outer membrane beta-barrel protein [Myxococcota bacterium]|nr:outer membrane beta-barrel protein [Myxococcota bacterium]MBU1536606.1 outer membrane beta-barrel protein [Myxococcota bacterium]
MKKVFGFFAVLAMVFVTSPVFAQDTAAPAAAPAATPAASSTAPAVGGLFGKGRMMVGGNISYNSTTISPDEGDDQDTTTLKFAPFFGYFIMPNIAIIGSLSYQTDDDGGDDDMVTISLNVGARYYHAMGKFNVYGGAMLGYMSMEQGDYSLSGFGLNVHGGALYMLGPNWGVDAGLQIQYYMGSADMGGASMDLTMTSFALGYFGIQAFF